MRMRLGPIIISLIVALCRDPSNTGSIDKTLKEREGGVTLDGSARRNKEEGETAGPVDGGGNSFRFVVCWLFVRVFCSSIRLEQTEHRAVNLLKEVESVNASERTGGRESEQGGRYAGRKLTLSAAGSLAKQLGSIAKMGIKIEVLGASPSQPSPLTEDLN